MKKTSLKRLCFLVVICMILAASVAVAGPSSIPGGPHLQPNQNVSQARWITFDEMEDQLFKFEGQSKGRMIVEVAGETTNGMPIYVVKFGEADTDNPKILIQNMIHGDEMPHTEATMDLIKTLATSGNKDVLNIIDNVTVWFVPMLNVEGAMNEVDGTRWPKRRNNQTWTPEEWGFPSNTPSPYYHNAGVNTFGFDINRDFNPDFSFRLDTHINDVNNIIRQNRLRYPDHPRCVCNNRPNWHGIPGFFVTPEARTMASLFNELQPDLVKDLHQLEANQTIEGTNDLITLWITAEGVCENGYTDPLSGQHYDIDPDARALGKQVNSLVYQKLNERGNSHYGNIALYQDLRTIGMGFASYELNGAAIMLYEFRGFGTKTTGQKGNGNDIRAAYVGMYETLKAFADGSIYDVDPTFYDTEIPYWGEWIGDPWS